MKNSYSGGTCPQLIVLVNGNKEVLDRVRQLQRRLGGPDIRVKSYGWLVGRSSIPRSTYVFADIEGLDDWLLSRVKALWFRIRDAAPDMNILNDPNKGLDRFSVMTRLHAANINRFRVERFVPTRLPPRFPVFVRGNRDHLGPVSELLRSPGEYESFAAASARRPDIDDLVTVEFIDYADAHGWYTKFGCVVVGDAYWTNHAFRSREWMVKRDVSVGDAEGERLDRETLTGQPHRDLLAHAVGVIGADYGRLDYCLVDGAVQVFEFNTNPTFRWGIFNPAVPRGQRVIDRLLADFDRVAYRGPAGKIRIQSSAEARDWRGYVARARQAGRLVRLRARRALLEAVHGRPAP